MHRGPRAGQPTDRAQTAVLGLTLMLFFALVLVGAVVAFGITAVSDGEAATAFSQAERSMAVLDAEADRIAYDDEGSETVHFGSTGSGRVFVAPDRGRLRVVHNYTNTNISGPVNKTLYDRPLGSVRYQTTRGRPGSDLVRRSLAYEGGGVFRYGGNETTTVADPDLSLRAGDDNVTMTVPVIRTNGTGAAQGDVRTRLTAESDDGPVFPNASDFYANDSTNTTNPLAGRNRTSGNVTVFVTSDYYRGWADHLNETATVANSTADVRTFPDNRTVKARFVVGAGNVTHLHVTDNAVHVRVH